MSIQLKLRRGTTAQHSTFTGAEGEVTVDTTKDTLVVHDGATPGGAPLLKEASPTFTGTLTGPNVNYTGTLTGGTGVVNIGSGQFYKDTSGNVGIGTSSPTFDTGSGLSIVRSGASATIQASRSDAATAGSVSLVGGSLTNSIFSVGAKALNFFTDSTERARIDSSGNVGIGTSSPAHKLDINGNTNLVSTAYLSWDGSSSYSLQGVGGGSGYIRAITGGNEAMRLTAAGLLQFNSGYGSVATAYGCRAWVTFNGTGTVAIRGSGNVSSITDNGVGNYTVNFSNAMPDSQFAMVGGGSKIEGTYDRVPVRRLNEAQSASYVRINTSSSNYDCDYLHVAIFR